MPAADDRPESDDAPVGSAAVQPTAVQPSAIQPSAAQPRALQPEAAAAAIAPVDVDGVGAILYGTIAWTVALVVCLLLRDRLAADGHTWWAWVCLAAALLGLAGLWFVRRRRDAYAAAKASLTT